MAAAATAADKACFYRTMDLPDFGGPERIALCLFRALVQHNSLVVWLASGRSLQIVREDVSLVPPSDESTKCRIVFRTWKDPGCNFLFSSHSKEMSVQAHIPTQLGLSSVQL